MSSAVPAADDKRRRLVEAYLERRGDRAGAADPIPHRPAGAHDADGHRLTGHIAHGVERDRAGHADERRAPRADLGDVVAHRLPVDADRPHRLGQQVDDVVGARPAVIGSLAGVGASVRGDERRVALAALLRHVHGRVPEPFGGRTQRRPGRSVKNIAPSGANERSHG